MFTLGNVVFLVLGGIFLIIFGLIIGLNFGDTVGGIVGAIAGIAFTLIMGIGIAWYNTNTASGIRAVKDYRSEIDNGINRTITITAEDGREIYSYNGKVDVELDHSDNYIKFETEEGKRVIIVYGITDTVSIIEN